MHKFLTAIVLLLSSLVAAPLAAAPPLWARAHSRVEKTPEYEDTIVEVDGEQRGRRVAKDGKVYDLVWERDPKFMGLKKHLHPHLVDAREFLPEKDPLPTPGAQDIVLQDLPPTASDHAPVTVDVNYFFTEAAATAVGGDSKLAAFAALSCTLATQSYANSGLSWITFRCLGPWKVSYVEANNQGLSWEYYSLNYNGTAQVNGIVVPPTLRDKAVETGADLSHLVAKEQACGIGYINSSIATGLSLSDPSCTNANITMAHETGHNMGFAHNPTDAGCASVITSPVSGQKCCAASATATTCNGTYNYGHAFPIGAVQWRTIMTYPGQGGTRITQISNPNILYQGLYPTGIANERDNARIAAARAPVVAAFRTPVPQQPHRPSKVTNFSVSESTPVAWSNLTPANGISIANGTPVTMSVTVTGDSVTVTGFWSINGGAYASRTTTHTGSTYSWTETPTSGAGTRSWYFSIQPVGSAAVTTPARTINVTP